MIPNLKERFAQIQASKDRWKYAEALTLLEALIEEGLPLDMDVGNGLSAEFVGDILRKNAAIEAKRAVSELRIRRIHFEYANYTATLGIFERTQMPDGTPAWQCFHDVGDEIYMSWFMEIYPHALDQRDLPIIRDEDAIKIPAKRGYYRRYLLD